MKADEPPNLEIPTATLAGAPPGAFWKAGASASDTPETVGTKSINISPKHTTSEVFASGPPFEFMDKFFEPSECTEIGPDQ
ncbi:hypothetical protein HanIR_Chr04g0178031 [Helianthus annuus]|nr:hypothetical protein HanIR_Chr04g0178031 [Helianthus annuus]